MILLCLILYKKIFLIFKRFDYNIIKQIMKNKIESKQIEIASKYSTNDEQFIDNMRILQEFLYKVNNILIEDIYKEISNKLKDVCNDNLIGPKKF